jgi:NifU-like protein involved in Fe-S cluster formation
MYSEIVLDHFKTPRNQGMLADATAQAHRENPVCGDVISLSARIGPAGRLEQLGFRAVGCPPSLAAVSYLTEWAQGRTVDEAARLTPQELEELLGGLPPNKRHAANLAVEVLRAVCSSRE